LLNFDFKGYGYGSGASFLNTDRPIEKPNSNESTSDKISQSPPKSPTSPSTGFFSTRPQTPKNSKRTWTFPTSNDICPRCSKAVYAAEAVNYVIIYIYFLFNFIHSYTLYFTGVRCWS
jgi:hypothetical protein